MKRFVLSFALAVGLLTSASTAMAQTVNMSRYITLTVTQGEQIKLDLKAAADGTVVKIVSGSNEQIITVNTGWTGFRNYYAGATSMTVYGDITGFDCGGNGANLTTLDVRNNTALTELYCDGNQLTALNVSKNTKLTWLECNSNRLTDLDLSKNTALTRLDCSNNRLTALDLTKNTALIRLWCYNNSFTTQVFNDIMCALSSRTFTDNAKFFPLWNASDANAAAFMDANAQIATNKNWLVLYSQVNAGEMPATTGTYTCPIIVNMSKYITLTVQQGQQIQLYFKAAADGTGVKIVSGSTNQTITIASSWTGEEYTAGATTMTIYGDITEFNCSDNGAKITALDVTKNTALTELSCRGNQLTALDVTKNTALTKLSCTRNQITALDVSRNTELEMLDCFGNQLTALDVSKNTALVTLWCYGNKLTDLDLSKNTALTTLRCSGNKLTALDVTKNTALTTLRCSGNKLTALDVTKNTALTELECSSTPLTTLDVTKNTLLRWLECSDNQLTALDVTRNTALEKLYCYRNNFTTRAFDDIMCALPARATADDARFYPLFDATFDPGYATFMAATAQIAKDKNWNVLYGADGAAVPATNGTYTCPVNVNMNKYITLTVQQGQQIQLDLKAAADGTLVKIVSGFAEQNITVGTDWTDFQDYYADATTMTVYGDITGFDCGYNGANLTALDVSKNTGLTGLYCSDNRLTALDVSKNVSLTTLKCSDNQITALDVSKNVSLTYLNCKDNSFTTQAFDDLMCSLPARTAGGNARFFPLFNASDANAAAFMAANSQIATGKNWQVRYFEDSEEEIPPTTGTYVCPGTGIGEVASVALTLYPNPATDILTIETEATGAAITLADLTGRTVLTATATATATTLNIAHLSAGTYIVRVGNKVSKVIKK